jgi:hypothetical protein
MRLILKGESSAKHLRNRLFRTSRRSESFPRRIESHRPLWIGVAAAAAQG